jgi:uncharacterized damage-inducible protein DinB
MTLNPYAVHLGNRDAAKVIAETPAALRDLAARIGPGRIDAPPSPGKWSARQILCHLADCEIVFAFRLRQALADDHHVIQPFDQERWARQYDAAAADSALATFGAVRAWNLTLLTTLPADASARRVTHPERGEMTFATIVETMGGHDLNHRAQLEAIAARG